MKRNENQVFKLTKALDGLKHALRAWYKRLNTFLIKNNFSRGKTITALFRKINNSDLLIVHMYVDDIIFCASNEKMCKNFSNFMQIEFEMNKIGELRFFQ